MTATDLTKAMNNFSITKLEFSGQAGPAQSPEFYVDRSGNPFGEVRTLLLGSQGYDKILFTGHIGSGKSTELNRIAADPEVQKKFMVVRYSVSDELDIMAISHIDVLISIGAKVFELAVKAKLRLNAGFLKELRSWKNTVTEFEKIQVEEAGVEAKAKLSAFFATVLGNLKREHLTRKKVREELEPRLSELLKILNLIIDDVKLALPPGKDLLVVIDDLDHITNIEDAKRLYREAGSFLLEPRCKIIYTIPIALHYSAEFKEILNVFGMSYFLPNVRVRTRTGKPDPGGFQELKTLVSKRMDLSLIDDDALKATIENSGGVVRELVRILRDACVKAVNRKRGRIALDLANESCAMLRNEFGRMLDKEHYEKLEQIKKTKIAGSDPLTLQILHNLAALEYQNNERWCDIHPLVDKLLQEWGPQVTP
jgi:hypothetical protein